MARMVPPVVSAETPASERRVFEALKTASESTEWTVLHSLGFSSAWTGEFGEIDFVVIIPRVGIICVEVKGGTVAHDNGIWTTRRHDAPVAEILKRSPFRQAQEGMWKLKHAIEAKFGHGSLEAKCPLGWLVILPDVACPPVTPEFTREEVIDQSDLTHDISARFRAAPSIVQLANRRDLVGPAQGTCRRILDFLRPNFERVELVSTHVWDAERRIQALTEEQYGVLDAIDENPTCLIKGPAGTGKTNLALECARRLSLAGKRVLLACYNRNLGGWLRGCVGKFGTQIAAGHIHGLLRDRISRSSLACDLPAHGEAEADELYGRLYFELGALAIYEIGERFDAILVDETQDMDIARLADVIRVWTDGIENPRIILFGDFIRQALYGRPNAGSQAVLATFPGIPVFNLGINCRNTRRIAVQTDLMCGYTGSKVSDKQPEGDPVEVFFANGASSTKRIEQIVAMLRKSGHRPGDAVILGPRRREKSVLAGVSTVGGWRLRDLGVAGSDDLAYATIHSFKGLERPVVIVIEAGTSDPIETDSLLYVAMSRARVRLFVICREESRSVIEKRMFDAIAAMPGVA
jgi:hypothetical protein